MSVTDSRRLARNPQVVRRRRACENCQTTFQTEERPRLWISREGDEVPFLRGVLLASLRQAAADVRPPVSESDLSEVVRSVVVGFLAEGSQRPTAEEIRARTGRTLIEQGLETVAYRYDASLDPDAFVVEKKGGRAGELFDRDKLKHSIAAASAKFFDAAEVEDVVDDIEGELGASSGSVDTSQMRELVEAGLRRRDERAFLRYSLGGDPRDETLDQFLDRVAPAAQVLKRNGAVVVFEPGKLAKSIRLSFVAERREECAARIAEFVAAEERRIRDKLATDPEPEPTENIGRRVLEWLFDLDERAWANYWIAFVWDHELAASGSPTEQLAQAHADMRARRDRARGGRSEA